MQYLGFGVSEKPKLLSKTEYKEQDTIFKEAGMLYSEYLEYMTLKHQQENIDDYVVWQTGMNTDDDSESEDEEEKESEPCGSCKALEGQIFHITEVPEAPHKNCKCGTIALKDLIFFENMNERLKKMEEKIKKVEKFKKSEELKKNVKEAKKMSPYRFYKNVRNGGKWDYKQQDKNLADFGNFNYGATGSAILNGNHIGPTPKGLAEQTLLRGAGWAQGRAGTSTEEWGHWYEDAPYGDDPQDQEYIQEGINWYYENY